jgi:hypothetical protein
MSTAVIPSLKPPLAATPPSRLEWLFRDALRRGQMHPLLHLIQQYRGAL